MPRVVLSSYIKKNSYFHKLNPLTKGVITFLMILLAFIAKSFVFNLILFALIIPIAYYSKVFNEVFKPIKLLFIIFVILFGIQSFFYPFHQVALVELPFGLTIWKEGVLFAAVISSRLLVMLVYGYWFMLTTHPGDLVSELKERGLPNWMGYVIITTLQLIPQIQTQLSTIIEAQRSRGLETQGNVIKRLKAYVPLMGPLFMGSVQRVVERSMAIEARAFSAECKKTRFRDVPLTRLDKQWIYGSIIFSVFFGVIQWVL